MQLTNRSKVILGIAGTIVLGAIGSGVWELFFSPVFSWLGRGILTIVTLGLDSVRNAIYAGVAKGHREEASLFVYTFLITMILVSPFFFVQIWMIIARRKQEKNKTPEQLAKAQRARRRVFIFSTFFLALVASIIYVRGLMHTYTNAAITHFYQSLTIVLPYISMEEERQFRSDFARIAKKEDYAELMEKLKARADSRNIKLPQFPIW
jgi:hypothetical protein